VAPVAKQKKPWATISVDAEDIVEVTASNPSTPAGLEERRRHRRHGTVQHVAVTSARGCLIADLLDLSPEGAKLKIVSGTVPNRGEAISITLIDECTISGSVSWLNLSNIGISFKLPLSDVENMLSFETLGRSYFSKALRLQSRAAKRLP
jgi:hypothetical protein